MNQNEAAAQASAEDEERAKVHKAQEVLERTSASVGQVCLSILTLLAIIYTLYFAAESFYLSCWRWSSRWCWDRRCAQ